MAWKTWSNAYGESAEADFRVTMLPREPGFQAVFEVDARGLVIGPFRLHVPGRHNVLNAAAAVAVAAELGVSPDRIATGLARFSGVDRRFQIRGSQRGVTVVDAYGHHPTEIRATLSAARESGLKRAHVLFQPHRYSRTRDLMEEFATAFRDAARVEVVDIYPASEQPIEGVTAQALVRALRVAGTDAHYAGSFEEGANRLAEFAVKGEGILTLGAGSISQAAPMVLDALKK